VGQKKRTLHDPKEIEAIIQQAQVCRLALSYENRPYIVPLNFGYKDRCLYFHTGKTGKKIDILKKNPQVCFEMDVDLEMLPSENPCKWNMRYRSVIGYGKAAFIEDPAEKRRALDVIVSHYSAKPGTYPDKRVNHLTIIEVCIERMTGKHSDD
jgi:nitroimidazol reductase NimA-like FMN-containing flavoprotein (pyridoxamine 5'-phosphate oxidase superfamily)